jgi:hypothetical protein
VLLKWILILFAIWLLVRWVGARRRLGGRGRGERLDRSGRRASGAARQRSGAGPDRLADLTEQEITDADFEEIP